MRYACPSCKRVFFLDTNTVSPCPACGTTLTAEGEDGGDAAPSRPPVDSEQTAEMAGGGSWLLGDSADVAPFAPAEEPPLPAQPPPQPSATSWLPQPAAEPTPQAPAGLGALEQAGADQTGLAPFPAEAGGVGAGAPVSEELATIGVSAPPAEEAALEPMQAAMPATMRLPPTLAPSGSRLFVITGVAVLLVGGIAFSIIFWLRPGVVFEDVKPDVRAQQLEKDVADLERKRDTLSDRLGRAKAETVAAKKELGAIKLKCDEFTDENETLKESLGKRSDAARLTLEAMRLLERRSDLAGALRKTDEALGADPGFLLAQRVRGQVLAASGLAKESLVAFARADEAARKAGGPVDAEALVLAGEVCLTDLADEDQALGYYKKAADSGEKTAFVLAAEARALQLGGRLEEAAAKAAEARKASPSLALAPLVLGEVAFLRALAGVSERRKGLLEEADKLLADATRLDPGSARASLMRGKVLLEKARLAATGFGIARLKPLSDAERCLETARRLGPRLWEVHLALGEMRLVESLLRNPAIAHSRAQTAVELTAGRKAPALALLAAAQAASGDPARAVSTIDKAIKIDPRNSAYPEAKDRYERDAKGLSPR